MSQVSLALDHIVVAAERLEDGVAYVEDVLGVEMAPGGTHPKMGTHNRLIGLGGTYLEVIAIDPEAQPPLHPRWFDLDNFSGPPRLTNWVAKTSNLAAAIALAPPGSGAPMDLARGDLTWQIAINKDGTLPFDGAFPGLIAWGDTPHPTTRLPDVGCSLVHFAVCHPDVDALRAAFAPFGGDLGQSLRAGALGFCAEIQTPHGARVLT